MLAGYILTPLVLIREGSQGMGPDGSQQLYLQFLTRYFHYSGTQRCRVTTIARQWTGEDSLPDLIAGFDQEAACCLMARVASYKMEVEEDFDATRQVNCLSCLLIMLLVRRLIFFHAI